MFHNVGKLDIPSDNITPEIDSVLLSNSQILNNLWTARKYFDNNA